VLRLYDEGYRFPRVAGTSAGAIVAALVAAYQRAGRDLHELEELLRRIPMLEFVEEPLLQRVTGPDKSTTVQMIPQPGRTWVNRSHVPP
jgi:NTE family protein